MSVSLWEFCLFSSCLSFIWLELSKWDDNLQHLNTEPSLRSLTVGLPMVLHRCFEFFSQRSHRCLFLFTSGLICVGKGTNYNTSIIIFKIFLSWPRLIMLQSGWEWDRKNTVAILFVCLFAWGSQITMLIRGLPTLLNVVLIGTACDKSTFITILNSKSTFSSYFVFSQELINSLWYISIYNNFNPTFKFV